MIQIYGSHMSSAGRCLWLLEEIGVPYERLQVDLRDPAARKKYVDEVFIGGKVPFLIDGDVRLFESMAINTYLAAKYKPELLPSDPYGRALVDQWSFWAISNLSAEALKVLYHSQLLPEDQRDPKQVESGKAGCARYLAQLEDSLTGEWLVGKSFTLADLNVASVVNLAARTGLSMGPRVTAWLRRNTERAAFKKVFGG